MGIGVKRYVHRLTTLFSVKIGIRITSAASTFFFEAFQEHVRTQLTEDGQPKWLRDSPGFLLPERQTRCK